jgi:drug/metabolite transporter (DMT)-like permease
MKNMAYVLLSIGLVILTWGAYGNLLNAGTKAMGNPADAAVGVSHFLPFIFVGVAYFLIAVLVAWAFLAWRGEPGNWSSGGVFWSFLSGVVTAVGALGVILAMTSGGSPIYVMPLIFGGAPVVNTVVSMWLSKSFKEAGPLFYAGLILVIVGAVVVLVFSPTAQTARKIEFLDLMKVLSFVLLTAVCWGCYGPLLHKGQMQMHGSRMRPFICVGLAYVVVAVIMPLILRVTMGDHGYLTFPGTVWSLAGGVAGALGSLGVILAFTYGGRPIYVMPLVFGGAPVVNTFVSMVQFGAANVSPFFYAGLIVVVAGAISVLVFAPRGAPAHPPAAQSAPIKPAPSPAP